jgi:methionyl-tRNA formyltransferase
MRVTAGLDSGPVCAASELPVGPHDTYGTLCERLQDLGAGLLAQTLDRLAAGERLRFVDQDEDGASYAEKIGPADRLLDASRPAVELERTVRALSPHVGARLQLPDGSALGVRRAALAPDAGAADSRPGALYASGERLLLACSSGTLELLEVQPPGKRAMPASAYLRGHGVPPAVA